MNDNKILEKNRIALCRVWDIPREYWDGKYQLQIKKPDAIEDKKVPKEQEKSREELYREIERLNGELVNAWKKIAELQENLYRKLNP